MSHRGFKLARPCPKCPFRTDVPGYLRRARAVEIAESIAGGSIFPCHQTTVAAADDDNELIAGPDAQFCAGALIVMEKQEAPNQAARMAENIGLYDASRLDMDAPVVSSLIAFVDHHDEDADDEVDNTCRVSNHGCEAPAGMMVGGLAIYVEPDGEVHTCEGCGEPVCDSCSDEKGLCAYCADEEDD